MAVAKSFRNLHSAVEMLSVLLFTQVFCRKLVETGSLSLSVYPGLTCTVRALTTTSGGQREAEFTFLGGFLHSYKYLVLKGPIDSFCKTLLLIKAALDSRIKNTRTKNTGPLV